MRTRHNRSAHADSQHQVAASRRVLRSVGLGRQAAHMKLFCVIVSLAVSLILVSSARAQVLPDYRCTIDRIVSASPQSENVRRSQEAHYIGKQFTVERQTGVMAGVLKNSYITRPVVVDGGSAENAFKVVATMRRDQGAGAGSNIYALTVVEYERSAKKPFVFLENDLVYFGQCEHF